VADRLFSLLLYLFLILVAFWLITPRKHPRRHPAYHLACLLEDAPESALTGQYYELATPFATPIACIVPQTWRAYYRTSLARPDIDYWQWRDQPESDRVCLELNWLFSLPKPQDSVREILATLASKQDPFYHPYLDLQAIARGNNLAELQDRVGKGRFADRDFRYNRRSRDEFRQWHLQACERLGKDRLKAVYRVCYGASWEFIAGILYPSKRSLAVLIITEASPDWWRVLAIVPFSTAHRVEHTYKTLLRYWHPDRNPHPNATEITAHLNHAYECYRLCLEQNRLDNAPLWWKIRAWMAEKGEIQA
jgi:hypothetical protein